MIICGLSAPERGFVLRYVLIYLAVLNIFAFLLMGVDKLKARRGSWRIPEKALFLSAILGGSLGAMLGMAMFRHKTKHMSFVIGMPMIFFIEIACAYYFYFLA